jgi:hypothetical protein
MSNIIGTLIAILTFPGVIIHEVSHRIFCDFTRTPVYEIKYMGISKAPLGYVAHKPNYGLRNNILVFLGPFIFNNLTAIFLSMPYGITIGLGAGSVYELKDMFLVMFMMWLSFSCAFHSFPSSSDVENLTKYIDGYHSEFIQLLYFPFRLIFFIHSILSIFLIDALWAFTLTIGQIFFWGYLLNFFERF